MTATSLTASPRSCWPLALGTPKICVGLVGVTVVVPLRWSELPTLLKILSRGRRFYRPAMVGAEALVWLHGAAGVAMAREATRLQADAEPAQRLPAFLVRLIAEDREQWLKDLDPATRYQGRGPVGRSPWRDDPLANGSLQTRQPSPQLPAPQPRRGVAPRGGDPAGRAGGATTVTSRLLQYPSASPPPVSSWQTHVRDGDAIEVRASRCGSRPGSAERGTVRGDRATALMRQIVSGETASCALEGRRSYDREVGVAASQASAMSARR